MQEYEHLIPKDDLDFLIKLFMDSNRGFLITMRALAICTKIMDNDDFKGDLEIVQDKKDMKSLLAILSRLYRSYEDAVPEKQQIDMKQVLSELGELFPNEKWNLNS